MHADITGFGQLTFTPAVMLDIVLLKTAVLMTPAAAAVAARSFNKSRSAKSDTHLTTDLLLDSIAASDRVAPLNA
mgnify:CR=1 FL=1